MELIERYIYNVTKRLPAKSREEVAQELRANILDMLGEDYTQEDVKSVLYSLGNPAVLAEQYQEGQRYLVGPPLYGVYQSVLKIVLIVVACATLVSLAVQIAVTMQGQDFGEILGHIIGEMIIGLMQGFAYVTAVFAILGRIKSRYLLWPYNGKEWTVEDLDDIPSNKTTTGDKVGATIGIVLSVVFVVIFCFFSHLIAWYTNTGGSWEIIPLFNAQVLYGYVPAILILAAVGVGVEIARLAIGKWNIHVTIFGIAYNIASLCFTIIFLGNTALINPAFKEVFASTINVGMDAFERYWQLGMRGLIVLIVVINLVEIASYFYKLYRAKRAIA
ncbi:hypothetical protein LJC55_02395 [Eubacteriales bacterium OttesenSCG-928-N14]|nr:hypothetical protein [Eubacteriales bacterium OttesenSCG-928-N14]